MKKRSSTEIICLWYSEIDWMGMFVRWYGIWQDNNKEIYNFKSVYKDIQCALDKKRLCEYTILENNH